MNYYRILSLDGGGIRGLLTCKLLERLEKVVPGFLSKVDLFAGTSTGGILALGLASGLSPAEMAKIYQDDGEKIFTRSGFDFFEIIERFSHACYGNKSLEESLRDKFKNMKLGDLPKKVLISSFLMDNKNTKSGKDFRSWKPKFFHNYDDGPVNMDCYEYVVDVALHTSAAPTYFPLHKGYADGGLVANNPSMCALAQAIDTKTGKQQLKNIALFSVGTGMLPKWVEGFNENWGFKQWAPNLLSVMMDGVSGVADYQCRALLGPRYNRLNMCFERDISLDSVAEIPYLVSLANVDLEDFKTTEKWLKKYYGQIMPA